jgi:hypothetical protein
MGKYLPDVPEDPPDEELTPSQLHDRFERVTNLDADELREVKDSERNRVYKERNSDAAQPGDEPLDDAIRLAETPASEWEDKDDAFNEVEEARELLDFVDRTAAQGASRDKDRAMIPEEEPHYGKQEMSLVRWGVDPYPDDSYP